MGLLIGGITITATVWLLTLLYRWSNRQEEQRQARAHLIAGTYQDHARPARRPYRTIENRVIVDRPPALTAPIPHIDPDHDEAIEHHAAEEIAAAQFMLDKVWTQKGYDRETS